MRQIEQRRIEWGREVGRARLRARSQSRLGDGVGVRMEGVLLLRLGRSGEWEVAEYGCDVWQAVSNSQVEAWMVSPVRPRVVGGEHVLRALRYPVVRRAGYLLAKDVVNVNENV